MPNRIGSISANASSAAKNQSINHALRILDREAVVKQFKGNQGESLTLGKTGDDTLGIKVTEGENITMVVGKYQSNPSRYGTLYYQDGVPLSLDGQAPDDGRIGRWTVPAGRNVLTELGG